MVTFFLKNGINIGPMQLQKLESADQPDYDDDSPPVLGNWNRVYVLVLMIHALFIILFYLFTRYFS